ncbi:universal stress protein [Klenkia soli]|uniref:universal stress protein n=1 Tax=Klenkia soli TaxID=1052260 RepID=UPI0013F4CA42|nr:universal stress protein [Klenkia soli]
MPHDDDGHPGAPRAVVGLAAEGRDDQGTSLRWAVAWAVQHGARLDVLVSHSADPAGSRSAAAARLLLGRVLAEAPGGSDVPVVVHLTTGAPGPALVHLASTADLLVVGGDRRPRPGRRRLLPLVTHCLSHAVCPVLVVPGASAVPSAAWTVVVGIDGSARSRSALRRARWEASDGQVRAVTVVDTRSGWPPVQSWARPGARARRDAEDLRYVPAGAGPRRTPVEHSIVAGRPADVLAGQDADLLVVGAPALRSVRWFLTSTANRCLGRRPRPVLVVPFDDRVGDARLSPGGGHAPSS